MPLFPDEDLLMAQGGGLGGLQLTFDVVGLEDAFQLLDMNLKLGAVVNGARLKANKRTENPAITNANIFHWQGLKGRDVITPNASDVAAIGQQFVESYHQAVQDRMARIKSYDRRMGKYQASLSEAWAPVKQDLSWQSSTSSGAWEQALRSTGILSQRKAIKEPKPLSDTPQWANQVNGKMLRDAMKTAMSQAATRHINEVNCNGVKNALLSVKYAAWKKRALGFDYPTLKATGQLTDAINPTGPGGRNIQLERQVSVSGNKNVESWKRAAVDFGRRWLSK
jgi:hypothetical protein